MIGLAKVRTGVGRIRTGVRRIQTGVRRASRRRRLVWAACVVLTGTAVGLGPVAFVHAQVGGYVHDAASPTAVPTAPVALVLGAHPSPFLSERVQVAADLWKAGRVRALLMSGDHSRVDYDEVAAMAVEAQRLGVPASAIVTDHAGFDTYSSCYRARSVWGLRRVVVVSQPFHLARAVWTCRALGVEADGAATRQDDTDATYTGWVRELPAIHKAVVDVWRGRTPTFPGPREHTLDDVPSP